MSSHMLAYLTYGMGMIFKVNFTFYYLKCSLFVHYEYFFIAALQPILSVSSFVFFLIWLTFSSRMRLPTSCLPPLLMT